jgi:SAM-dependent methyltransferase
VGPRLTGRWEAFEQAAPAYEAWYETPRGKRAGRAERDLLEWLLAPLPNLDGVLEVGCGTGHFTAWLAERYRRVVGLDRAPGMVTELRRRHPRIPAVVGDAHRLPLDGGTVDVVIFVATLEFLDAPETALAEAVTVARRGVIVVALNRWSLGGLSRRWGSQARRPLLGGARDLSLVSLTRMLRHAAGRRLCGLRQASTLFPDGLWNARSRLPLGAVIGMAALLTSPTPR